MPESRTQPPDGEAPAREASHVPSLRREGEYWTIVYDGVVFRLRDAKGLHCLALLLKHRGQKFAAVELLALTAPPGSGGAAGTARRATDLEEARVVVTKRITAAVKKIQAHHPSLGHHLRLSVKTGAQCVYLCDPDRPLNWVT